jgi:uncharacterized protein YbgA (DUF1722 family)/uncharacterized protein YbbK (DUF523 family)
LKAKNNKAPKPIVREDAARPAAALSRPVRIGISTCLLGEKVRYDGGHKHDPFLTDTLGRFFQWVPVCPEVEVGMGTPREPIHLVQLRGEIRLAGIHSATDHTIAMREYAEQRVEQLADENLSGYILKKDSPSCGPERVRVHHERGRVTRSGRGLFAAALAERFPSLPIEDEGRLRDLRLRENWIERVFAYHRLQTLWASHWRLADLVEFHTGQKLVLLAHSPQAYRQLSRLVAGAKSLPRRELRARYEREFMGALTKLATSARHTEVLHHMVGYLRDDLDPASRRELLDCVEDYRGGLVPLVVPVTLIAHYARVFDVAYLKGQVYLTPHPKELALRQPGYLRPVVRPG